MRIIIAGAAGRMGRMLVRCLAQTPALSLHAALEHPGSAFLGQDSGILAGIGANGVLIGADMLGAFPHADGVVDFTTPATSLELAALAAQARIVHVIGTTGFSDTDRAALDAAARHATLIVSGNMSLGVSLLAGLIRQATRALGPDWDVEIVEMHHRAKVDAPSGTALLLAEAAARGRNIPLNTHMDTDRAGHRGAREQGRIGMASLRGGSVIGDHTIVLAGQGERIELTHRADDRAIFAHGALRAVLWGQGKPPGLWSMADVLGLDMPE